MKFRRFKIETRWPAAVRRTSRVALGLVAGIMMQACSTSGSVERWTLTENRAPQAYSDGVKAGSEPVTVVFFRDRAQAPSAVPFNIYINGQYQASLVGSAYSQQALCPGSHRMAAAREDAQRRYVSKDEGQSFAISTHPVQYFRVSEGSGGAVSIHPATPELAGDRVRQLQTHTVPRVSKNGCAAS